MKLIEQLKYHEKDELTDWYVYEDTKQRAFLKEIVSFSKTNPEDLKRYCKSILPTEFSTLSLIYEALSRYSNNWSAFLFEEIKRVIKLAETQRIEASYMEVLTTIEMEDIYTKEEELYIEIMNFIVANLNLNREETFTIELLDVFDWYIIELDEVDQIAAVENWKNKLHTLANEGVPSVQNKAKKVLKEMNDESDLTLTNSTGESDLDPTKSISLFSKIKNFFK